MSAPPPESPSAESPPPGDSPRASGDRSGRPWSGDEPSDGVLSDEVLVHLQGVARDAGLPASLAGGTTEAAGVSTTAAAAVASARYEVRGMLGQGGMGTVYLALDRHLDREVALKVVSLPEAGPEESRRLLAEARILARLEHPGLVPVHDAGTFSDGRVYYAMKRVQGRRLDAHVAEPSPGAPPPSRAERLRLFERICDAVAFAHAQGVIHRDLKPENVMVGAYGEVLVIDWGLARLDTSPALPNRPPPPPEAPPAEPPPARLPPESAPAGSVAVSRRASSGAPGRGPDTDLSPTPDTVSAITPGTAPGTVMGTPGYRAPELARAAATASGPATATAIHALAAAAAAPDERADVFSLGAILTFLLTGTPPPGAEPLSVAAPAAATPAVPRTRIPKPLAAICRKAMAAERAARYASVTALAADLSRFAAGEPVDAYPENLPRRAWRLARRHATPLLLLLTYLLVRLVLLVLARRAP